MLLRSRVTLIVSLAFLGVAAGLSFGSLKREELADQRFAEAMIAGQDTIWRKIVENLTQGLLALAPSVWSGGDFAVAVGEQDRARILELAQPTYQRTAREGLLSRLEVLDREGRILYSSTGSVFPNPLLDAGLIGKVVVAEHSLRGIQQDAGRLFAAAAAVPIRTERGSVGALTLGANLDAALADFKRSTGADGFLIDLGGELAHGTDPGLWSSIAPAAQGHRQGLLNFAANRRVYMVASLPVTDISGRIVARLVTAKDASEDLRRRTLLAQISIGLAVAFLVVVLLLLYTYLQRSFAPLDQAIAVLNALSRGDTTVTIETERKGDEIGRIAGTVEIFRQHAMQIEALSAQRERQRRRQEKLIRREMQELADMLDARAREAVLQDLRQIEESTLGQAQGEQAGNSQAGQLAMLAMTMRTMSRRIREQHESLTDLIAERTRDLETVREALRQKEQLAALRQELDFARQLQLSSLPRHFPAFPDRNDFQVHAHMIPAREVGGDYYDFFLIDQHRLGFVIGDASGKGVSAAMFIAMTRSLVRALLRAVPPGEALAQANDILSHDNSALMFATVFAAILDTRSGEVVYCNAGHNPPFLIGPDGAISALAQTGDMALGVMEGQDYGTARVVLRPGATLFLYTDGVTEATDPDNRLFTDTRLIELLRGSHLSTPAALIEATQAGVSAFVREAPQADDITALVLRYLGAAKPAKAKARIPHSTFGEA